MLDPDQEMLRAGSTSVCWLNGLLADWLAGTIAGWLPGNADGMLVKLLSKRLVSAASQIA
eukprot:7468342-Heterocapsa_arctica.AAC.1